MCERSASSTERGGNWYSGSALRAGHYMGELGTHSDEGTFGKNAWIPPDRPGRAGTLACNHAPCDRAPMLPEEFLWRRRWWFPRTRTRRGSRYSKTGNCVRFMLKGKKNLR